MPTRVTTWIAGLLLASTLACGGASGSGATTSRVRFAYVVNALDKSVSAYSVDRSTGALTPLSPATAAGGGVGPAVVVQDKFLYLAGPAAILAYSVDKTTGACTYLGFYDVPYLGSQGITVSPDGQQLFAAASTSIYAFQVGATGALTAIAGSPFSTSPYLADRLSAAGPFLLASGATAILTLKSSAGVLAAPQVKATSAAVGDFVGSADGRHAYAADTAGNVAAYTVDPASGAMTAMAGPHTADAYAPVVGAVLHPGGKYLYVANADGDVTRFNVSAADGSLSPATGFVTSPGLTESFGHVFTDPDGRFLYLTNNARAPHNYVLGFSIDPATGSLTQMASTFPSGEESQGMVFITD